MVVLRASRDSDLDEVSRIFLGVVDWLHARGIRQWMPGEFQPSDIQRWHESGELHAGLAGDVIVGSVLLQRSDPRFWPDVAGSAVYVHKLVVDRNLAGRKLGAGMLEACERHAADIGAEWVRLDTCADNPFLVRYYLSAGYRAVGNKTMQPASAGDGATPDPWEAALFEKRISSATSAATGHVDQTATHI